MKCSKNCEWWRDDPVHVPPYCRKAHYYCLYCGSPLTEEPKMITRTVTYPAPISETPPSGYRYYLPDLTRDVMWASSVWMGDNDDLEWFNRGLIYPTADLAIQRAKAMIGDMS